MRRTTPLAALAVALACVAPRPAAGGSEVGYGVRAGFTSNPDAFVFGGQVDFDGFLRDLEGLSLQPSFEIGFGKDRFGGGDKQSLTSIRLNGNFRYLLALPDTDKVKLYPLAGLAYYHLSLHDCDRCRTSDIGLNLGGGARFGRFGIDVVAGIDNIPDLSVTASYSFGR